MSDGGNGPGSRPVPSGDRPRTRSPGASARSSLLWGGGSTLLRDLAQLGAMLVLVRVVSPADYGSAALAQSVLGLIAVLSFNTFLLHAFQHRDPARVDWQAHFTAAVFLNTLLFGCTLCVAWFLSTTSVYSGASWPLAVLSTVFLIEIPASLRHRMLEVEHDWARFRGLITAGTMLGLGVGIAIGVAGGGKWAIIVQPILFGIPAALDLFLGGKWRPDWSWSWLRYRDSAVFGVSRIGSGSLARMRQTIEQARLAGAYDLASLGEFTRSTGLATMLAGRIGAVMVASVYPVLTRAEPQSSQFQRYSGLVLMGASWTSIPAALFMALSASDLVELLYGPKWSFVVALLPLSAIAVGVAGIGATLSQLLLANNQVRASSLLDAAGAGLGIVIAIVLIPFGVKVYLVGLVGHAILFTIVAIAMLLATKGIGWRGIAASLLPTAVASVSAAGLLLLIRQGDRQLASRMLRLALEGIGFGVGYVATLRLLFPGLLRRVLGVAPGGHVAARCIGLGLGNAP